jgi:hypothetical protein
LYTKKKKNKSHAQDRERHYYCVARIHLDTRSTTTVRAEQRNSTVHIPHPAVDATIITRARNKNNNKKHMIDRDPFKTSAVRAHPCHHVYHMDFPYDYLLPSNVVLIIFIIVIRFPLVSLLHCPWRGKRKTNRNTRLPSGRYLLLIFIIVSFVRTGSYDLDVCCFRLDIDP